MCDWCGHDHPVTALCSKRPKWSRRGFLALMGAGLAGMALLDIPLATAKKGLPDGTVIGVWSEWQLNGVFSVLLDEKKLAATLKDAEVGIFRHPNGSVIQIQTVLDRAAAKLTGT